MAGGVWRDWIAEGRLATVWKCCCGPSGGTHTSQRMAAMTEGEDKGLWNERVAKGHKFFIVVVYN